MAVVDLTADPLEALLPRRVHLSLADLMHLETALDLRLPITTAERAGTDALAERLGDTDGSAARDLVAEQREASAEPIPELVELLESEEFVAAWQVFSAPETSVDLVLADSRPRRGQLTSWHRVGEGTVACLSTVDGLTYEFSWFLAPLWANEITRVATVSGIEPPEEPRRVVSAPYELLLAVTHAIREDRPDLVPEMVALHAGAVQRDGEPVDDAEVGALLSGLQSDGVGRLQATIATASNPAAGGLVSWILRPDGWLELLPIVDSPDQRVLVTPREPGDLAGRIGEVLSRIVPHHEAGESDG